MISGLYVATCVDVHMHHTYAPVPSTSSTTSADITSALACAYEVSERSVVRNGQWISQYLSQGLANPHPQSIVNGTNREREVARPTVTRTPRDLQRPPVIVYDNPPKNPDNPFSWSANGIAKSPAKIGRALLAGHTIEGRRAAVRPKPAIGAAPAPGA